MLLFGSGANSCGLFPFLPAGLPAGAAGLRHAPAGARSIPRDTLWPRTHRWDGGHEGTELRVPLRLPKLKYLRFSPSLANDTFWQNAFLKSVFPAMQVFVEKVFHPFLFQNNLPIKVIHTCYLLEGNGRTSPRQRTHRLSLIAIVSCVFLLVK